MKVVSVRLARPMALSDFDFELPSDLIALRPASPRDSARLLVVQPGNDLCDRSVRDLPSQLKAGDALVFNDTRVIPARLIGRRFRDGASVAVEATLHRRLGPSRWTAFMRPGKRLKIGDRVSFSRIADSSKESLESTIELKKADGEVVVCFDLAGTALDAEIMIQGHMPLPPYIAAKRAEDDQDLVDYQTVYASRDGSVAAPTAGLHFTPELLARLDEAGIARHYVTLHVGAGTFLPVKVDDLAEHVMHAEYGEVSADTAHALNRVKAAGGRVICVGTTSLRLLESAAAKTGMLEGFQGETSIFITPGYRFLVVDGMMTNFHLPKSTLFMLVSAFSGLEIMRAAYAHAIGSGYRFYSYGDSSLLWRAGR